MHYICILSSAFVGCIKNVSIKLAQTNVIDIFLPEMFLRQKNFLEYSQNWLLSSEFS
jgi:hypothetical protein